MDTLNRFRGCLLGLAVGDAVGTTVEFQSRGTFPPVTDMVGGGPFNLRAGEWTDDTSMALCLATSLIEMSGFDARDQMDRYNRWNMDGYLSSTGDCFDIGNTTYDALSRYRKTREPFSGSVNPNSAGNGSIMRLAPVPMFYFPNRENILHYSSESSRTTHGTQECLDACRLFGDILYRALDGKDKSAILTEGGPDLVKSPALKKIAAGAYFEKSELDIRGIGYVVNSLEAALWCFWTTDDFKHAILRATNLGDDADTTAAVCGQVAGAYYGDTGIPVEWLQRLVTRADIEKLAERLYHPGSVS
jgi:ADP-ribosyl-[dinitrogen reductase] hydrolase